MCFILQKLQNTNPGPTIENFAELLGKHTDSFYAGRTAASLMRHWQTLRSYHLLPDQTPPPAAVPGPGGRPVVTFADAEELARDQELSEPPDEALDRELKVC